MKKLAIISLIAFAVGEFVFIIILLANYFRLCQDYLNEILMKQGDDMGRMLTLDQAYECYKTPYGNEIKSQNPIAPCNLFKFGFYIDLLKRTGFIIY